MSKRANGEGSIYTRSDGRWCAALVTDDLITGERIRTAFYGKTRTEVRIKMKAAIDRAERGGPVRDAKATVAAWLRQWQDTTLAASSHKETTKELYRTICRKHLEPAPFGAIPLDRLRPSSVEPLILELRRKLTCKSRFNPKGKPLSDATVQRIFTVLRVALAGAVRDGLIATNPAAAVKQPKVSPREAKHLTVPEMAKLLQAAEGSRFYPILTLITATGLRKGEALALTWSDIDMDRGIMNIRGTLARIGGELKVTEPKTAKSRRTIYLSPSIIAMLKKHRKVQIAEQLHAGSIWAGSNHVFTSEAGGPLEPTNVLRAVRTAAHKAGLTGVNVHTLRHSAATAWLENGVNLKAVSELLGHSDIRVTAGVYGHVSDDTARAAMDTLSDVLGL